MRINSLQLRNIIRGQLRTVLKEQDAGILGSAVKAGQNAAAAAQRGVTPEQFAEVQKTVPYAAISAAHNAAKKNAGDPVKFGVCAYAFVEIYDSIQKGGGMMTQGLSSLSGNFMDFAFSKAIDPAAKKDYDEAVADGKKFAEKIPTDNAAFSLVAGDTAAEEAKKAEEVKKEMMTKVRESGKSFELKDKDAVIRMQKWLMTQPAAKGKKIAVDGLYGAETHAMLIKALPDNLPNATNFKKLKFEELMKDDALREDLAQFMVFKDMPWNKNPPPEEKKKEAGKPAAKKGTTTPTPAQQAVKDKASSPTKLGGTPGGKGAPSIGGDSSLI